MKRRDFGLLAGTSLATATVIRRAKAQSTTPDATLLTTTLTPYGAERAGNADGSIPAWTGGYVLPPTAPDQTIDVAHPDFLNDAQLYTVNASNLAQYENLLTPGLQTMITKFGYSLNVFPTHRTAAAPQYVYDNIAKNVTRASLDPAGGRLGFDGAYGGIPFPIINTSDPDIGGAQLIWNHLTHWEGYSNHTTFSPAIVVSQGVPVLSGAEFSRFIYPYYDPNGSPETYAGYYSKLHLYIKAPASAEGQEQLVWHSTNVTKNPDIVWELLNGQGRVRKAPNEAYDTPNPTYNGISNIDESQCFYGSPSQYDWKYITKREMLVPYNNNAVHDHTTQELCLPKFPNPALTRWEKHRVWVVEATLHPGSNNVLSKRRLYIDEDTGQSLLGEAYDMNGTLSRAYMVPVRTVPSIPMVNPAYIVVFSLLTGDYVINGNLSYPPYKSDEYSGPQPVSDFEPQQMAAQASF